MYPNKSITYNDKDPQWFNEEIKQMTNNKNEIYRQHIRYRKLQHNCNGLESISNKYADRNLKTIKGKVLRAFQQALNNRFTSAKTYSTMLKIFVNGKKMS